MDAETYPDKAVVKALNDGFVAIRVDAEKGEGPELVKKFSVEGGHAITFVDGNEESIYQLPIYMPPDKFIEELRKVAESVKKMADVKAALAKDPKDANATYEMGLLFMQRGEPKEGFRLFDEYARLDPDDKLGHAMDVALIHVEVQLMNNAFADAEKAVNELMEKHKDSDKLAKAYLYLGFAQLQQSKVDEAMETLKAGVAKFPKAEESKQAQEIMKQVEEKRAKQPPK